MTAARGWGGEFILTCASLALLTFTRAPQLSAPSGARSVSKLSAPSGARSVSKRAFGHQKSVRARVRSAKRSFDAGWRMQAKLPAAQRAAVAYLTISRDDA